MCEDTPIHGDLKSLDEHDLEKKRTEWLKRPESQTGGIQGLLPLVMDMPVRLTDTDPKNKTCLFKNRRCRLVGWQLHKEDVTRLENCSTQEMKLEYVPHALFVRMPEATWIWSEKLGPGVIAITPATKDWFVDGRSATVKVKRRGFSLAADFSGTGHSFAGATLPAAWVDCLPWHQETSISCLLYTSPSPRDRTRSRMPSSA